MGTQADRIGIDSEKQPALRHVVVDLVHGLSQITCPAAAGRILRAQLAEMTDHLVEDSWIPDEVAGCVDADQGPTGAGCLDA